MQKSLLIFLVFFSCTARNKNTNKSEYKLFIETQKKQVISNGYKIQFIDKGKSDKVILLVHGVPTSSWVYRKMINLLVDKGYRVIAPDLLGYGNSDKPEGYEIYSPEKMGSYLLELMDSLKVKTWTHVCHDAGGLWTWEMLKKDPSKVNKLILLNTIILKSGFNPPLEFKKNALSKTYVKSYTNDFIKKPTMISTIRNGINDKSICTNEMLEGYIEPTNGNLDRALYQFFSNTCVNELPDYKPLLSSLKIPIKIIWGKDDKILNFENQANELKQILKLTDNDIHLLENTKHFIQEEAPLKIVELIE